MSQPEACGPCSVSLSLTSKWEQAGAIPCSTGGQRAVVSYEWEKRIAPQLYVTQTKDDLLHVLPSVPCWSTVQTLHLHSFVASFMCQPELFLYLLSFNPLPPVGTRITPSSPMSPPGMRKDGLMWQTRHSSFHLPRPNISRHISDTKGSAWVPSPSHPLSRSLILIPSFLPHLLPPPSLPYPRHLLLI